MTKQTILTPKGFEKISAELEYVKGVSLPAAEINLKSWKDTGDANSIKEAMETLEFYKQRIPYLENMLLKATVINGEAVTKELEETRGEYAIVHSWWKRSQERVIELYKENREYKDICADWEKMSKEKDEDILQLKAQLKEFKAFTGLNIENIIVKDSGTGEYQ